MFSLAKVTAAAYGAASKLLELQLRGEGDEGDDEGAVPFDAAPFYEQLGLAARPVVQRTLRALVVPYGGALAALKLLDKALRPTNLQPGETRVFAAGKVTVSVSLLANGNIAIVSDGGDVVINGGTQSVARVDDAVAVGTLTGTAPPGGGPITFVYTNPNNIASPPGPTATFVGKITTGAVNVKA